MPAAKPSPVATYERLQALEGGEDLSTSEYTFGALSATGVKKVSTTGNDAHCVIIKGGKTAGETCEVLTEFGQRIPIKLGTTSVAIATGDMIKSDNTGAGLPAGTGDANGTHYHGVVVGEGIAGTSAKAGKYVDIIFMPSFHVK